MLLIGFYQAENIEFETLFTNIPLADCKGHCCDGASSMAGAKTNLATRINGDTIKGIKLMNGTLDTAFELNKLAIYSLKREGDFNMLTEQTAPGNLGFRTSLPSILDN